MIIECIKCSKKFEVNSELIPSEGRTIQCGSCNHIWFFTKKDEILVEKLDPSSDEISKYSSKIEDINVKETEVNKKSTKLSKNSDVKIKSNKGSEIVKYKRKSNFSFNKFLSFILVGIISFIGFIIVIDTFKIFLYSYFPSLEKLLFNLFETLKDIKLFVKDLI